MGGDIRAGEDQSERKQTNKKAILDFVSSRWDKIHIRNVVLICIPKFQGKNFILKDSYCSKKQLPRKKFIGKAGPLIDRVITFRNLKWNEINLNLWSMSNSNNKKGNLEGRAEHMRGKWFPISRIGCRASLVQIHFGKLHKVPTISSRCSEWPKYAPAIQLIENIMVLRNLLITICIFLVTVY